MQGLQEGQFSRLPPPQKPIRQKTRSSHRRQGPTNGSPAPTRNQAPAPYRNDLLLMGQKPHLSSLP